jgi:hypothetical protein
MHPDPHPVDPLAQLGQPELVGTGCGKLVAASSQLHLGRHAGNVDEIADVIRYAPRSSVHHRALQRAIVEGLEEGEFVAFRGMDWGWGTWARKGWDIPFKPSTAGRTIWKGPKGLRLTEGGLFITDLDAAWALNRSGLMDWETLERVRARINKAYGKDIVLHGHHWQGLKDLARKVYAIDNGKDYVRATVYVYGKNINGIIGFLDSGSALNMYRKYHSVLVP